MLVVAQTPKAQPPNYRQRPGSPLLLAWANERTGEQCEREYDGLDGVTARLKQ